MAKKDAKKAVSEPRAKAYEGFYKELGTKARKQKIYNIANNNERESRDLDQVRCIKNEIGNVLVTDKDIKNRWEEYFYKLFNDGIEDSSCELEDLTVNENASVIGCFIVELKFRRLERLLREWRMVNLLDKMVYQLKFGNV